MIFVECNPDIMLVQVTKHVSRNDIVHEAKGKGAICSRLSNTENCVALLDEDPGSPQPPYINKIQVVRNIEEHDIKIMRDNSKKNIIIILIPKLEDWILRAARLTKLDVGKYNLPDTSKELHSVINYKLDKYGQLLVDLEQKHSPMFVSLKGAFGKGI